MENEIYAEFTQDKYIVQKYESLVKDDNIAVYLTLDNKNCTIDLGLKQEFLQSLMFISDYCDKVIPTYDDMIRADNIVYEGSYGERKTLKAVLDELVEKVNQLQNRY